jgi:hypothetical protein
MSLFRPNLAATLVALLALSCSAGAQGRVDAKVPKLTLTLTAEKTSWRAGEAVHVKIRIENASGQDVEIPSNVSFMADNRGPGGDHVTMSDGVFSSPVSLTKAYADHPAGCENDLSESRVRRVKGTNIVEIFPDSGELILKKGEAKEYAFDISSKCWHHYISAYYADSSIFPLAEKYKVKTYRVFFSMQFPAGTSNVGGVKTRLVTHLKSNAVEVEIN